MYNVSNRGGFMVTQEEDNLIQINLIRSGFKLNLLGFKYFHEAILQTIEDSNLVYDTDKLFKTVAKAFNVQNPFRVEANMHNAVTVACNNGAIYYINELFHMEVLRPGYKPTSAEVVKLMAEYISLKLYKFKPKRKKKSETA